MIQLSDDPAVAEAQMVGLIVYLTTFGHIDGEFDPTERAYIQRFIQEVVGAHVERLMPGATAAQRAEKAAAYGRRFAGVLDQVDRSIQDLWSEPVARGEDPAGFVEAKLKLRCFEIFRGFDRAGQEALMVAADELLMADGHAHPAELKFRGELAAILQEDDDVPLALDAVPRHPATVRAPIERPLPVSDHPFFAPLETHYAAEPAARGRQLTADRVLIARVRKALAARRQGGEGRLRGHADVGDFYGQPEFLDRFVHVLPGAPGKRYELTVLGDLHGCYSCLKAALHQARFFEKVEAFERDPARVPEPRLVLLGDYIDRGIYSYNGVLRAVMRIAYKAPRYVYMLRGNHEYYLDHQGQIYGGVKPAEAIDALRQHAPVDYFRDYVGLFNDLPHALLFDRVLFVHGGLPREHAIREHLLVDGRAELAGLNAPDVRFQMLWSDPSTADAIPAALQEQTSRFSFGRLQARRFLELLGCHTLVRGHERIDEGFRLVYDDEHIRLVTLFSVGGTDNDDLPLFSSYRFVTPMALTVTYDDGEIELTPWAIDYERFVQPEHNRFYAARPELRSDGGG